MVTEKRKALSIPPCGPPSEVVEELALDEPVSINVNGDYYVTLIATPEMREELAAGILLTQGVIDSVELIESIGFSGGEVNVRLAKEVDLPETTDTTMNLIVTACASSPTSRVKATQISEVSSDLTVNAGSLREMIAELNRRSSVHMRTRGTHAAMLCSREGRAHSFAEDVGRHNAVDKAIGSHALAGGVLGDCVLLSTGRQSGEMVQKAARCGVPVVASLTVPLVSGIRLAEASGVTLAGFSGGGLKVYANPDRIKVG